MKVAILTYRNREARPLHTKSYCALLEGCGHFSLRFAMISANQDNIDRVGKTSWIFVFTRMLLETARQCYSHSAKVLFFEKNTNLLAQRYPVRRLMKTLSVKTWYRLNHLMERGNMRKRWTWKTGVAFDWNLNLKSRLKAETGSWQYSYFSQYKLVHGRFVHPVEPYTPSTIVNAIF